MKTIRILAFLLAAMVYSSVFAAIGTYNATSGGLWVTVYDRGQNTQFDHGCVPPGKNRTWTNKAYGMNLVPAFVVRAELTPDADCKQPRKCDTTMTVSGNGNVRLNASSDSYGKEILSKCYWTGDPPTPEEFQRRKKEDAANLKECRARTMPTMNPTSQLLAKVKTFGKASKQQMDKWTFQLKNFNEVLTAPFNDATVSMLWQQCPMMEGKLREMQQEFGHYLPPGAR